MSSFLTPIKSTSSTTTSITHPSPLSSTYPPNIPHIRPTTHSRTPSTNTNQMDIKPNLTTTHTSTTTTPRRTPHNEYPYGKAQMHNIGLAHPLNGSPSTLVVLGRDANSITPSRDSARVRGQVGMPQMQVQVQVPTPVKQEMMDPTISMMTLDQSSGRGQADRYQAGRMYETPTGQHHQQQQHKLQTALSRAQAGQQHISSMYETPAHAGHQQQYRQQMIPPPPAPAFNHSRAIHHPTPAQSSTVVHPQLHPHTNRTHPHQQNLPSDPRSLTQPQSHPDQAYLYSHFPSLTHIKRRRKTSPEELAILEGAFLENALPSSAERTRLSRRTGMSPRGVQIWFQNKRQTEKRKQQTTSHSASQPQPHPLSCSSPLGSASGSIASSSPSHSTSHLPAFDMIRHPSPAFAPNQAQASQQGSRQQNRLPAVMLAPEQDVVMSTAEEWQKGMRSRRPGYTYKSGEGQSRGGSRSRRAEREVDSSLKEIKIEVPRPMHPLEMDVSVARQGLTVSLVEGESPSVFRSRQASARPTSRHASPMIQHSRPNSSMSASSSTGASLTKARFDPYPAPLPRPLSRTGRPLSRASSSGLLDMKSEMIETDRVRNRIRGWEPTSAGALEEAAGGKENQRPTLGQRSNSAIGILSLPTLRAPLDLAPSRPRSSLGFSYSLPPPRPHSTTGVAVTTKTEEAVRLAPIGSANERKLSRGILDEMCLRRELPWVKQESGEMGDRQNMDNVLDRMKSSPGEMTVEAGSETDTDVEDESNGTSRKRKRSNSEHAPQRLAPLARKKSTLDAVASDARPMLRRLASLDYYAGTPARRNSMLGSQVRILEAAVVAEGRGGPSWNASTETKWTGGSKSTQSGSERSRSSFTRASSDDSFATGAGGSVNILTPSMDTDFIPRATFAAPGSSPSGKRKIDEHDKECAFLLLGLGTFGATSS